MHMQMASSFKRTLSQMVLSTVVACLVYQMVNAGMPVTRNFEGVASDASSSLQHCKITVTYNQSSLHYKSSTNSNVLQLPMFDKSK